MGSHPFSATTTAATAWLRARSPRLRREPGAGPLDAGGPDVSDLQPRCRLNQRWCAL